MRMILTDGLRPVTIGVAAGAGIAFLLGRFLASLLFAVSPTDPAVFALVFATVAASRLACLIPARRAAGVSPLEARRHE